MTNYDDDYVPRLLAMCVAGLLILAACMLYCLPRPIAIGAISWAMLSISVGVSFGHAVLNEP
jgi:dolichol kinase